MDLLKNKKRRELLRKKEEEEKKRIDDLFKKPEKSYIPSSRKLAAVAAIAFIVLIVYLYYNSEVKFKQACGIIPGLECDNIQITDGQISFDVHNYLKEDINLTLSLQGCEGTVEHIMRPNNKASYSFECDLPKNQVDKDIAITYVGYSGLPHDKVGRLTGMKEVVQ